ncbi:hypothetical protein L1987_25736 [Smallanthus sonchifolius]|uniref:Uncharacterized protein n=1 Tax=Smallanthus sonchifolius TaxID=185202 RepID=A0ACB9I8H4_9ASTR|nr:hypothetical protein L1987_25736 [Smallanthus sonchifolius]
MSFKFKLKSIKKLIHAQKACKSFTEIFRSKLHIAKVRKVIKKVTTFLVSSRHKLRFRPMRQRSNTNHHFHLLQEGSPAIFIGELYVRKSGQPSRESTTNKDKEPEIGFTSAIEDQNISTEIVQNVVSISNWGRRIRVFRVLPPIDELTSTYVHSTNCREIEDSCVLRRNPSIVIIDNVDMQKKKNMSKLEKGRYEMGRNKLPMKRIENNTSRLVTFCKRRNGLIKKAYELSVLCDIDIALIMFSPSGRLNHFSCKRRTEDVLNRFVNLSDSERGSVIQHREVDAKTNLLM